MELKKITVIFDYVGFEERFVFDNLIDVPEDKKNDISKKFQLTQELCPPGETPKYDPTTGRFIGCKGKPGGGSGLKFKLVYLGEEN